MPNIKQQEKRVRQAARQRQENLRWRSTAKTLMRRLNEAVAEGDAQETETRHRELMQWLDRAAASGALHRHTAARRQAHAAKPAPRTPHAQRPAALSTATRSRGASRRRRSSPPAPPTSSA